MENKALLLITRAVLETVAESDCQAGALGGPMYAAFMSYGMSLDNFQSMMDGIVAGGFLEKRGQCYFITEQGLDFMRRLQRAI